MKLRRFFVSLALAFAVVTLCGGVVLASPVLEAGHVSQLFMGENLKPNYDTANFRSVWLEIYDADTSKTGTLTLQGGNYAWWDSNGVFVAVPAGKEKTFTLENIDGAYYAATGDPAFLGGIDTGLSGMAFSFTLGGDTVSGKMPPMRDTAKQLTAYVPYIELIVNENNEATGLKWRFVDPKDPSKELVRNAAAGIDLAGVSRIRVRLLNGSTPYNVRQDVTYKDGDKLSAVTEVIFDAPILLEDIQYARINFYDSQQEKSGINSSGYYAWQFFMPGSSSDGPFFNPLPMSETYLENGKTNHNYVDASSVPVPRFLDVTPLIQNNYNENGSITIDFKNSTRATFHHVVTDQMVGSMDVKAGETTFPTARYEESAHIPRNDSGAVVYFVPEDAQTALSERDFTLDVGTTKLRGKISKIRSTKDQMNNGCIPFLEFDPAEIAAGKITKATIRFVGDVNSTTAVTRDDDKRNVDNIRRLEFRMKDRSRYVKTLNSSAGVGSPLEWTSNFDREITLDDLYQVRLRFFYGDSYATNSRTEYVWLFLIPGAVQDAPELIVVNEPSDEELKAVSDELGANAEKIESASVVTKHEEYRKTLQDIGMEDFDFARTMSALFVSQDVAQGGAVVIGSGMMLPFYDKGYDDETPLTQPADLNDLRTHYNVLKSFPGGGAVNLLEKFDTDLFEHTPSGVIFNATLAIVDNVAPSDAMKPADDSTCGVKLNADKSILYIYDGEADGVAKDPIALMAKSDNGGGGSSGCATAGMILPFALFAAAVALRKRR